jgi:site-specific recombinase XerD
MNQFPCLIRSSTPDGEEARYALGDPLMDSYLALVAGRSRPNTLRAVAHDLKTFFSIVDKDPVEVVAVDVFEFVAHQRGDRTVIRISDGESGLSARTIARRLSSISGLYAYLIARGDTSVRSNPVPRGLSTRRRGGRRRRVPLVRVPRTLPKILSPAEVNALLGALRTHRDRAMVYAMVLGGLRRCEVLGLCLGDVQVPERSLFIADGKGGHQRVVPISNTFFAAVGDYLRAERPKPIDTDRVFVTLKGPNRGRPMTADGWTRSFKLRGRVRGWNGRRVISCAIPV